jgi:[ribosomal protein S18]-alanine N-acetyltransferase
VNLLTLKPLTADLLPAAVELDQVCFGRLWTLEGYRRELESPNSELIVLQPEGTRQLTEAIANFGNATLDQSLIIGLGCFWSIVEEAHITIVAVHPDYQRQGLGQALLWALLSQAQQRGLERATLEVRVSNQAAIALYEKFGFREAGRRRRYYEDTGEDALILWRGGLQYPEFAQTLIDWQTLISEQLSRSDWWLDSEI